MKYVFTEGINIKNQAKQWEDRDERDLTLQPVFTSVDTAKFSVLKIVAFCTAPLKPLSVASALQFQPLIFLIWGVKCFAKFPVILVKAVESVIKCTFSLL